MKVTKDLVDYLASREGLGQTELVEKDIYLHLLLGELSADAQFRDRYAFKGGTCLVKCYLGYFRFSEDLDFTFIDQGVFAGNSKKQIRRSLSREISRLADLLEAMAERTGLIFKADKDDPHFIEYGGSNRFATFKLWYDSTQLKVRQFIKVQVNFIERIVFECRIHKADNILEKTEPKEFMFLYPEAADALLEVPSILTYDIREILAEKARAILTRQGIKARDFVDIHMIETRTGLDVDELEEVIFEKTRFMLRYEKYMHNLQKKAAEGFRFKLGEEERLIIKPIEGGFGERVSELEGQLSRLAKRLTQALD